jgi:hypothetical protein
MITKPHVRKRRIQRLLDVYFAGGTPATTSFDRLQEPWAVAITRRAKMGPNEEALLVCFHGPQHWYLLTNERFMWVQEGTLQARAWADIYGVQMPPAIQARVAREELRKDAVDELEIFDSDGRKHGLHLEPGRGYFLMWNGLVALCNFARKVDPPDWGDSPPPPLLADL